MTDRPAVATGKKTDFDGALELTSQEAEDSETRDSILTDLRALSEGLEPEAESSSEVSQIGGDYDFQREPLVGLALPNTKKRRWRPPILPLLGAMGLFFFATGFYVGNASPKIASATGAERLVRLDSDAEPQQKQPLIAPHTTAQGQAPARPSPSSAAVATRPEAPAAGSHEAQAELPPAPPAASDEPQVEPAVTPPRGRPSPAVSAVERRVDDAIGAAASRLEETMSPEPVREIPESLSRIEVARALRAVAPAVRRCGMGQEQTVRVDLTIEGATGAVSASQISGEHSGTTTGSCVQRAVRRARFPQFQSSQLSIRSYPFFLR